MSFVLQVPDETLASLSGSHWHAIVQVGCPECIFRLAVTRAFERRKERSERN